MRSDRYKNKTAYKEEDILKGMELYEFCTNVVAQQMENNQGYTIDGIMVDHMPTQVVAHKDGQKYIIMVAGSTSSEPARVSYEMKRQFAEFYSKQGCVPMFASVILRNCDPEKYKAGIVLHTDDFYAMHKEEDLRDIKPPKPGAADYRAYVLDQIVRAYSTTDFSILFPFFNRNIRYSSHWVNEEMCGKRTVMHYLNGKGATLRESDTHLEGYVGITEQGMVQVNKPVIVNGDESKRADRFYVMCEGGILCALIAQKLDGKVNFMLVIPKFNE